MATIPTQERTNIIKLVVGMFNAAPGAAYLSEFTTAYQAMGNSLPALATALGNTGAFKALYPSYLSSQEFANKFLTTLGLQANQEAQDWVAAKVNAGEAYSSVILQALTAINNTNDAAFADAKALLNNKTTVAEYYSVTKGASSEDLGTLQGTLGAVKANSDVSNAAAIEKVLGEGSGTGNQYELSLGRDVINATQEGQTFYASLAQNQLGGVANTFESGDVINAKGTGNKLVADVAASGLIGGANAGPAISATTKNVQVVEFRAQSVGQNGGVHPAQANIDAQKMEGVKEWWSVNSRNDLKIEDVRTRPEDTTIGMRSTDAEVSFKVYFDTNQLKNTATVKNSALTLKLDSTVTPGDLSEVPAEGVGFYLDGVLYTLKSATILAAKNHTELLNALKAEAAKVPALKDVTFTLNANNTITLVDPAGKEFKPGGWQFDQALPGGKMEWDQIVGEPQRGTELITTTVELDDVGRSSAGGELDISGFGNLGVEKFNVNVDRSSWLVKMKSQDHAGTGNSTVDFEDGQAQYLQEVHLANKGANGNLKVGSTVPNRLDGRVADGLTDVRVVDGSAFKGNLNLGINLTDNGGDGSKARYLDKSTTPVQFNYTGGAGADLLNLDVAAAVANHVNFVLNVNTGAGNDRLVLATNGGRLNSTSVDGGEGTNTIVVNANVGINSATGADSTVNTFKSFKNFQNYEIEGGDHNFAGLAGVQNVLVADVLAGASNVLRNLPTDLSTVTVTGKNQTAGVGNSNNAQSFGTLDLQAAKSATATINLDNTALVNGTLTVANLTVRDDQNPATSTTNLSAVRTLNVVSKGVAGAATGNVVTSINAEKVNTFNLSGDHALTAKIDAAANTAGAAAGVTDLKVDGSALTAKLTLGVATGVMNAADLNKTVNLKGGAGTTDVLNFDAGLNTTAKTTVSGFETVSFQGGKYDAVNTSDVTLYKTTGAQLQVLNMKGVENVELGSFNATTNVGVNAGQQQWFKTTQVSSASTLNLTVKHAAGASQEIATDGFRTVNLKLDVLANAANIKAFDLNLEKSVITVNAGNAATAKTLATAFADIDADATITDKVAAKNSAINNSADKLVVTGGTGQVADTLELNTLSAALKTVDVSGYKGAVTMALGDALGNGATGASLVTTGNTTVKVGAYAANITDAAHGTAAGDIANVTTFQFTADAVKIAGVTQQWSITGFQAKDAAHTLGNISVLDLSALGIQGIGDLSYTSINGGADTLLKSNGAHNFEIVLVGIANAGAVLTGDNFKFAA